MHFQMKKYKRVYFSFVIVLKNGREVNENEESIRIKRKGNPNFSKYRPSAQDAR